MRRLLLAALAASLVFAMPVAAQTPPSNPVAIFLNLRSEQGKARTHSCAKGSNKQVRLAGSRATGDLAHKAVVACEQPPRSQPFVTSLKHTEMAALLALVG